MAEENLISHGLSVNSPLLSDLAGTDTAFATATNLSSTSPTASQHSPSHLPAAQSRKKSSPRLLDRMKWLDLRKSRVIDSPVLLQDKIGRIPVSQSQEHYATQLPEDQPIHSRGPTWSSPSTSRFDNHGKARLGSSYGAASEPASDSLSDHSSIACASLRMMASDTEDSDIGDLVGSEAHKYLVREVGDLKSNEQDVTIIRPPINRADISDDDDDGPSLEETLRASAAYQAHDVSTEADGFVSEFRMSRAPSIYTLSRVSFQTQIQALTSIQLPPAASLSSSISAIPTSTAAATVLMDASGQIKRWTSKAEEVLNGLDAQDDVDWAAAGGRDGLEEVDQAINRFETLINVYILAIEELESRRDIGDLPEQTLQNIVEQMDGITKQWQDIKDKMTGVKAQVELAMEWEELWTTVLGEIGLELEALGRLVFEMEERRHRAIAADTANGKNLDIGELETIVEETPIMKSPANNRFSIPPPIIPAESLKSPDTPLAREDSNLLALFARMQPLRASLDFLPMRLSAFEGRASEYFPSACNDLTGRRETLEAKWKKLEGDAESLRRELSEDQWIMIFRNAGKQAMKMCESVERSYHKLRESLSPSASKDLSSMPKKIESYEAKRVHYGPAVDRVIAIIDRGVRDRLTVNGEILRLQTEVKHRWASLQESMRELSAQLEDFTANSKSQQLRDSISSILSTDISTNASAVETPASSPASSVIGLSRESSRRESSVHSTKRQSINPTATSSKADPSRRNSSLPLRLTSASSHLPRQSSVSSVSTAGSSTPGRPTHLDPSTPTNARAHTSSTATDDRKPRWSVGTKVNDKVTGHNFKPLSATTPSPYRKTIPPRSNSRASSLPQPSPLGPGKSGTTPRNVSAPISQNQPKLVPPSKRYSSVPSASTPAANKRRSLAVNVTLDEGFQDLEPSPIKISRPGSALGSTPGTSRRTSLLPQPRNGRASALGIASSSNSGRNSSLGERPPWRH